MLLAHEILARVFGHEPLVDPVMHFSGGFAAALFFRVAWARFEVLVGDSRWFGQVAAGVGLACVVAVLWEIGEFAADQFLGSHVQRSLGNTMRDLILGLAGATSYALVATGRRALGWKTPATDA